MSPADPPPTSESARGRILSALLALGGLWLGIAFLAPSPAGRRVLLPLDIALRQAPFNWAPPPPDLADFRGNPIMSDVVWHVAPLSRIVGDSWRRGEVPLWNPNFRYGMPLLGNAQSAPFNVTNLPVWFLPYPHGFAWAALMRLAIAWAGGWLLARRLGLSRAWSFSVAFGFVFAPGLMAWFQHPNGSVMIWFPLLLWAVEGTVRADGRHSLARACVSLAAVSAMVLLSGHFHSAFNIFVAAGIWLLFRTPWKPLRHGGQAFAAAIAAMVVGGMVAAPAMLPFVEALADSATFDERATAAGRSVLGPEAMRLLWDPMAFGTHFADDLHPRDGPWNFVEAQQYVGLLPFVFIVGGLPALRRPDRLTVLGLAACAGTASIACALAFGSPAWLQSILLRFPPFLMNSNPRMAFVGQTAVVLAAGLLGRHWLRERALHRAAGAAGWILLVGALGGAVALAATGVRGDWEGRPWIALGTAGALLVGGWLARGRAARTTAAVLLPIVWMADVLPVWRGHHSQVPAAWAPVVRNVREIPALAALSQDPMPRVLADWTFPCNGLAGAGFSDLRAYDMPVHRRHRDFFRKVAGLDKMDEIGPPALANARSLVLLSRAGAPWLLTHTQYADPQGTGALQPVGEVAGHPAVYANRLASGFAEWRSNAGVHFEADPAAAASLVAECMVMRTEEIVLEHPLRGSREASVREERGVRASVQRSRASRIEIAVPDSVRAENGWIVVRESFDRGWRARAEDGRRLDVVPAQVKFMAVEVPKGTRSVVLVYRPATWPLALGLATAGLAIVGALAFLGRRRKLPGSAAGSDATLPAPEMKENLSQRSA